jgi:hypothetical protein
MSSTSARLRGRTGEIRAAAEVYLDLAGAEEADWACAESGEGESHFISCERRTDEALLYAVFRRASRYSWARMYCWHWHLFSYE